MSAALTTEGVPEFKPPVLSSRAQKEAEAMAARVDAWKSAHTLLSPYVCEPDDVLALARFLADAW